MTEIRKYLKCIVMIHEGVERFIVIDKIICIEFYTNEHESGEIKFYIDIDTVDGVYSASTKSDVIFKMWKALVSDLIHSERIIIGGD